MSAPLPPDVLAALQQGKKIEAIKRLRKSSGLGLAETKAVVDAYLQSLGDPAHVSHTFDPRPNEPTRDSFEAPAIPLAPRPGNLAPGEVPNSNSSFWWVLLLGAVALAGYYILER